MVHDRLFALPAAACLRGEFVAGGDSLGLLANRGYSTPSFVRQSQAESLDRSDEVRIISTDGSCSRIGRVPRLEDGPVLELVAQPGSVPDTAELLSIARASALVDEPRGFLCESPRGGEPDGGPVEIYEAVVYEACGQCLSQVRE